MLVDEEKMEKDIKHIEGLVLRVENYLSLVGIILKEHEPAMKFIEDDCVEIRCCLDDLINDYLNKQEDNGTETK